MAGIRRTKDKDGKPHRKWRFWFVDWQGKRQWGTGTSGKTETQQIAERIEDEHRQIRLGYRPPPKKSDKKLLFADVAREHVSWGESQGGRGGRPWSKSHRRMRKNYLAWWQERLGLELLSDLMGCLPRVEKALRELQASGLTGRTVQSYANGLLSFCNWCVSRGYLDGSPLKGLAPFDRTPKTRRRAMTLDEIRRLLESCPPERCDVYEVALASGLRVAELRALKIKNLSVERSGLYLEASWTKNRKACFQPLPATLVARLADSTKGKSSDDPLLRVLSHADRAFARDREAAGIPKWTPEGKLDFHALRVTYTTLIFEAGANAKEAQVLARHATANLTMNTYARTRMDRLHQLVEKAGQAVARPSECATYVQRAAAGAEGVDITRCDQATCEGRELVGATRDLQIGNLLWHIWTSICHTGRQPDFLASGRLFRENRHAGYRQMGTRIWDLPWALSTIS